jgi:UDP-2,3-diacylglucosamine hydrolase
VADSHIFTADLHLGSDREDEEARKEAALRSLLEHARTHAEGITLLGDLFDFWFPYRHAIPKRAVRILVQLGELHASGFPVRFVGGNHDFWLGDYLEGEFGLPARAPSVTVEAGGRRIFAAHGDDLVAAGDPGYRFLKRVLRNRVATGLFGALHPDIGIPLGKMISRTSREYTNEKEFYLGDALAASIERAFDAGHDAVVIGHLHVAQHVRLPRGECVVLAGWTGRLSIVRVAGGELRLEDWPP